jgi:hypothetical protein
VAQIASLAIFYRDSHAPHMAARGAASLTPARRGVVLSLAGSDVPVWLLDGMRLVVNVQPTTTVGGICVAIRDKVRPDVCYAGTRTTSEGARAHSRAVSCVRERLLQ